MKGYASLQAAYDAMEAPEDCEPMTDAERAHEYAMAYDRAYARAEYLRNYYAAFCADDDISF